jgi:hypothetical protein
MCGIRVKHRIVSMVDRLGLLQLVLGMKRGLSVGRNRIRRVRNSKLRAELEVLSDGLEDYGVAEQAGIPISPHCAHPSQRLNSVTPTSAEWLHAPRHVGCDTSFFRAVQHNGLVSEFANATARRSVARSLWNFPKRIYTSSITNPSPLIGQLADSPA